MSQALMIRGYEKVIPIFQVGNTVIPTRYFVLTIFFVDAWAMKSKICLN